MRLRLAALLAPVVLFLAPGSGAQEDGPTMLDSGTAVVEIRGREVPVPTSRTTAGPLFALPPLVERLGGELRQGPTGQAHVLRLHGVELVFGPGSDVVTRGREIVPLSQAPRVGRGGVEVPLDFLQRTFGELLRLDLRWDPQARRLQVLEQERRVLPVEWDLVHLQGMSTLVLRFPEAPRYRLREEPGRMVVELLGDELAPAQESEPVRDPLVRGLQVAPGRIVIDLAPGTVAEHYERSGPFRLVFDLYRREAALRDEPTEADEAAERRLPTVVLDPGHGGGESGANGPSGVAEKTLTLRLSQLLERRLEQRLPVRVELTRGEDADLPLETRTAIANQYGADLFISIHLNASLGSRAHGAETYFLSLEASDAAAAAAARAENRAGGEGALSDLELILWDLAQTEHLAESQRFATLVQDELNQALGLRDRGVKQAPFRVLMGAAMPAVLVELGFLSNPQEEARLQDPAYQMDLVEALVRAVARYYQGGAPDAAR